MTPVRTSSATSLTARSTLRSWGRSPRGSCGGRRAGRRGWSSPTPTGWAAARTLAEALPYIQIYDREIVVIKYGGHAMGEDEVARLFAADVVLLKLLGIHPVVVHGGGPQISRMLKRSGVESTFVDGLRVTDAATMEVAEMVLSGAVNKEIVNFINAAGREADVRGVGLSGKDARLITVEKAVKSKRDPNTSLEETIDHNPPNFGGFHIFTFNELADTERWRLRHGVDEVVA